MNTADKSVTVLLEFLEVEYSRMSHKSHQKMEPKTTQKCDKSVTFEASFEVSGHPSAYTGFVGFESPVPGTISPT